MWVNVRWHLKTREKEYRAMKHANIYWTKDKDDPNILDRGTEREAKLTKYRIMNSYDEYGYGYEELNR